MLCGFQVWNVAAFADVRAVGGLAALAESNGWDGFFTTDQLTLDGSAPACDPWMLLTAAALETERVRIGPMVTALPRCHPGKLAQEVTTLDHLSNGRVILGAGAGSLDYPESTAFGEPSDRRARADLVDETLEVLCQAWSPEPVNFEGNHIQAHLEINCSTHQRPRVPIWLAGTWPNKRPFRRAARWEGVFPVKPDVMSGGTPTPEETAAIVEHARRHRETDESFDVVCNAVALMGVDSALVAAHADAGATWFVASTAPFESIDDVRRHIEKGPPKV